MSAPRGSSGTPPKASPEPGANPGYAEDAPRDNRDAHAPHALEDPPSPDDGGVARETDGQPVPDAHDD